MVNIKNLTKSTSISTETQRKEKNITIYNKINIKTSIVYDTYWKFAAERQKIFFKRQQLELRPWTNDPILMNYKFTNAYRASDRVSQYLIKNVIYNGDYSAEDTIFRILLFKIFNKIETWEILNKQLGEIIYSDFDPIKYSVVLNKIMNSKEAIYSAAYIMASGKSAFGYERKLDNHLALLDYMMKDNIVNEIINCKSLENLYQLLIQYPTIGQFLAFQLAIDINYSEVCNFDEMEFIVPGPGAIAGIHKCFVSMDRFSETDIINYMAEIQEDEFKRLNLNFQTLWGRSLQLIDCQNIFCETDKYARIAHPEITIKNGRTRIKQKFYPSENLTQYFFPPKWGINEHIGEVY